MFSKSNLKKFVICGIVCLASRLSFSGNEVNDYFGMSLEELMDVKVTSASRTEQSGSQLSIPVSVLTADEIHASGLTTIPELLQLMPGVDVRRVDRMRYIIGVRGMMGHSSDRTLVLINGRSAMDSTFGAPDWMALPVLVEDIERIEVLRGPGGAAWGANALTGVINIITKKPSADLGNLFSTTINEYGDTYNHLRLAGSEGKWSWRVSAGYEDLKNSDDAGAGRTESGFPTLNGLMGFNAYQARDFSRTGRFDTEFHYLVSDDTLYSFGAAYTGLEGGDRELVGRYPRKDIHSYTTRLFARIDHQFDEDRSGYLQWYGNYSVSHQPHVTDEFSAYDNTLEAQFDQSLSDTHSLSIGSSLRWSHLTSDNREAGEIEFAHDEYDEYWAGVFIIDRVKLNDRLTIESQGRVDDYSETDMDWSLRLAAIYVLDDEGNHVLRAGVARAFRAAGVMVREPRLTGLGGLFNIIQNPKGLENESTYSLEGGYTGKFGENLTLQVNSYYQRIDNIIESENVAVGPVTNAYFLNGDGADTYGAEAELTYKIEDFHFTGWYAYNEYVTDKSDQAIRAYMPARHKAGLRMRWMLDKQWSLNANYTYNDVVHNNKADNPVEDAAMFHRLDLTVSRTFAKQRGEFMVGVADVLNKTQQPVYDVSYFTSYETPGRTFFARLQCRF